jgi:uncharacterized protein (DUF697 family)
MAKKLPSFEYSPKQTSEVLVGFNNDMAEQTVSGGKTTTSFTGNDDNGSSQIKGLASQPSIRSRGEELAKLYANWAAASGGIPVPLIDIAIITGVQVRLVASLADLYGVSISKHRARLALLSITGGGTAVAAGGVAKIALPGTISIVGSASKSAIGFGTVLGSIAIGAFAYSSTILLGRLFMDAFEKSISFSKTEVDNMAEQYSKEINSTIRTSES